MTWCRVGSRPATAARTATVLPAPTSPVMTPSRVSAMQKLIRAVAWVWASPKCAAHGARLGIPVLPAGEHLQPGEVDRRAGAGFLVVRGGDHPEVVDPGGVRRGRRGRGDGAVHVTADHERHRGPGRAAVKEHLDPGQ